ncbi:MAG TPA: PadR family transcriptional regulator [Streptosporangiaceae bacterium]|nr:PadR family transcriptional regulator [Streptosporangiaceae bacterium]
MMSEKLKGNLDMLLLAVLAAGPGHGYAIITRLRERSQGAFDLPEGTVYPALHRLEKAGQLDSMWQVVAGRRRRMYRLTAAGQESLAAEARQWQSFSGSVAQVLRGLAMQPAAAPQAALWSGRVS